jgi:hypothetical protein
MKESGDQKHYVLYWEITDAERLKIDIMCQNSYKVSSGRLKTATDDRTPMTGFFYAYDPDDGIINGYMMFDSDVELSELVLESRHKSKDEVSVEEIDEEEQVLRLSLAFDTFGHNLVYRPFGHEQMHRDRFIAHHIPHYGALCIIAGIERLLEGRFKYSNEESRVLSSNIAGEESKKLGTFRTKISLDELVEYNRKYGEKGFDYSGNKPPSTKLGLATVSS